MIGVSDNPGRQCYAMGRGSDHTMGVSVKTNFALCFFSIKPKASNTKLLFGDLTYLISRNNPKAGACGRGCRGRCGRRRGRRKVRDKREKVKVEGKKVKVKRSEVKG